MARVEPEFTCADCRAVYRCSPNLHALECHTRLVGPAYVVPAGHVLTPVEQWAECEFGNVFSPRASWRLRRVAGVVWLLGVTGAVSFF
jgi:hypothetical protein